MRKLTLQLFDYHLWANSRLLQHLKSIPKEVFTKEMDSVFPTIAETFGHMIAVDEMWYLRMKGENAQQMVLKNIDTIEETEKRYHALHTNIQHFLKNIENISQTVVYRNSKGESFSNSTLEIVQHIVNHGTYHRGNIASMIRQMGHKGISTDYIVYLRRAEQKE